MKLKKSKKEQKLYVAQIKTELVVAADSDKEALEKINKYVEDSIDNYTGDEKMAHQGWGFHLNELTQLEQLQDSTNADIFAYDEESGRTIKEIIEDRKKMKYTF